MRVDPNEAFETHRECFVKLSAMVCRVQRKKSNDVLEGSGKSEKHRHCKKLA